MAITFINENLENHNNNHNVKNQSKPNQKKPNQKNPKKKNGCFMYIIILLVIGGLGNLANKKEKRLEPEKTITNHSSNCAKSGIFGSTVFCLADFENYKEVSTNNLFKQQINNFTDEVLLAYYVDNETYDFFEQHNEYIPNDLFKIYSLKLLENETVDETEFSLYGSNFKEQFSTEWENSEKNLEDLTQINFDKPVLLKQYNIDNKNISNTYVSLVRAIDGEEEVFTINIINISLLKNKIIYSTYVDLYEGNESISKSIQKNDYFLKRFLDIN